MWMLKITRAFCPRRSWPSRCRRFQLLPIWPSITGFRNSWCDKTMDNRFAANHITNINEALTARLFPTVTLWNRLEGRPRTENFARALKAEVRDALWMLTKQWHMGEFFGDDAG